MRHRMYPLLLGIAQGCQLGISPGQQFQRLFQRFGRYFSEACGALSIDVMAAFRTLPIADTHLLAARHGQRPGLGALGHGGACAHGTARPTVTGATSTQLLPICTSASITVRCLFTPS